MSPCTNVKVKLDAGVLWDIICSQPDDRFKRLEGMWGWGLVLEFGVGVGRAGGGGGPMMGA